MYKDKVRFERKFIISNISKNNIEFIIKSNSALFSEAYCLRRVNNIYLDQPNLNSFFDNIDGNSNRSKVRIRWYGDTIGRIEKPILEIKLKNNLVGSKKRYDLKPFNLDKNYSLKNQKDNFLQSNLDKLILEHLSTFNLSLMNSYKRKYFISKDKNFRITVDFSMKYYKLNQLQNRFNTSFSDKNNIIVELKYPYNLDSIADKITNEFPYRITKSSKYVMGIFFLNNVNY